MGRAKGELSGLDPGVSNSERLVRISRELEFKTVEVGVGNTTADIKIDDGLRKGPLSAIVYGLRSIGELGSAERIVVLGCDLYLLSKEALGAFVDFSKNSSAVMVVKGVENWSMLSIDPASFTKIATLFDQGERRLSGAFSHIDGLLRVAAVDLGDFLEETFVDFDTQDEYLRRFPLSAWRLPNDR